jgi:hypothetical protein
VDLSLSVERLPADPFVEHSLRETIAGSLRLLERRVPGALKLKDLGAMYQADPVWATMSGCWSHQRVSAPVHSRARRSSYTLCQNPIVLQ